MPLLVKENVLALFLINIFQEDHYLAGTCRTSLALIFCPRHAPGKKP